MNTTTKIISELNRINNELNIHFISTDEVSPYELHITELFNNIQTLIDKIESSTLDEFLQYETDIEYFDDLLNSTKHDLETMVNTFETITINEMSYNEDFKYINERIINFYSQLQHIEYSINNLPLLRELISDEQVIVLVGKNGVGKSTLVDDLKRDKLNNLFCIPAQKYLFMNNQNANDILYSNEDLQKLFLDQSLKVKDEFKYPGDKGDNYKVFSQIINYIVREHQKSKSDSEKPDQSVLDEINDIFNQIFSSITLNTDSMHTLLKPKKDFDYSINSLSDGEKSSLFYIICTLLAKENTIFVIDEPETHLNMAICNKLWDLILEKRNDCKFIFVSHSSDFIASRLNPRIIWCKKYNNKNDFELEVVTDNNSELEYKLLIELVGSRKPVLFCEGTRDSLDYKLLNILFSDEYLIKPMEGHLNVVNSVRASRKLDSFRAIVFGLIDKDYHSPEKLTKYEKDGIYHLPVNEIEMLLMHQNVVEAVLEDAVKDGTFDDVKEQVKQKISDRKEKMASNFVKYKIEEELFKLSTLNSKNDIFAAREYINEKLEKIEEFYDSKFNEINSLIERDDYIELINSCNLKGEILGLMNKFENEYAKRALKKIQKSSELKSSLKELINLPKI